MKEIKVGINGYIALVDDEDFEYLNQFRWSVKETKYTWYANRKKGRRTVYMHRIIMNTPMGMEVDHVNGLGYDNRKENMRNCTHGQNMQNQMIKDSNYKGVSYIRNGVKSKKYQAHIMKDGARYCEYFPTAKEAAAAYNRFAIAVFGEFARLNIIEEL